MIKKKHKETTLGDIVSMMTNESRRVDNKFDELADMVARGFESNDKRFNHIENRMATKIDIVKIEQRLGQIEYHVDEAHDILKRFEENDILNLQKRVQILEKAARALAGQRSR